MAKRKAARPKGKKAARPSAKRKSSTRTSRSARKTARRAGASARAGGKPGRAAKRSARKAAGRKASARKAPARTVKARTVAVRKTAARKAPARKAAAPRSGARKAPKATLAARKAPALNRARRTVLDEEVVQSPPSSLGLDRTASAARSGRRELSERFREHTETSPAMTGGDIDADWESAYSVGDEAPGGDNPTPDQDIVDDIGKAIGVQYEDNEELKGEKKISDRDKHRWELDPASAEDYDEH